MDPEGSERPRGFSDELHARSRTAAAEQRRLLTALSTGTIAVFFLALTTRIEPALTPLQSVVVAVSLALMGVAVLAGILSWHADAKRNYYWARLEGGESRERKPELAARRRRWDIAFYISTWMLVLGFVLGVVGAVFYVTARLVAL